MLPCTLRTLEAGEQITKQIVRKAETEIQGKKFCLSSVYLCFDAVVFSFLLNIAVLLRSIFLNPQFERDAGHLDLSVKLQLEGEPIRFF